MRLQDEPAGVFRGSRLGFAMGSKLAISARKDVEPRACPGGSTTRGASGSMLAARTDEVRIGQLEVLKDESFQWNCGGLPLAGNRKNHRVWLR